MDAREDSYIQNLIKMIADLRQESYKQLQRIEALEEGSTEQAESNRFCTDAIVARIETLEAAQQPQQSVPKWHRLSEREPQVGDRCIYQCPPNLLHAFGTWHDTSTEHISRKGFWNNERGLFVGDPECISWRLAMLHEIPPATEESSATAPPAPAGGLVERVAKSLAEVNSSSAPEIWRSDACTAIRVIAAWLRSDGPDWPSVASLLEREAER